MYLRMYVCILTTASVTGSEIEDDPLSGVFNECDLSKDGRIDAYEFAACVEKNTTVRGPQADKLGHILRYSINLLLFHENFPF